MPLVSATVVQPQTYVRLQTSWVDFPAVTYVTFIRVNEDDCSERVVRVHTAYDTSGGYILLSCDSSAVVWDTEAPHGVPIHYRVEGLGTSVTADSVTVTVDDNDLLYLKDPVRPCHDLSIATCIDDPDCVEAGPGVMFAGMSPEQYPAHSFTMLPVNASLPITTSQKRQAAVGSLFLATKTFPDRDAFIELLAPGSPLLFQGLPVYGQEDRYLDIGTDSIAPLSRDLRYPVRVEELPYNVTSRPPGPSTGVCGTRFTDLCDIYATWGDIATAGLTWNDLLLGYASGSSGVTRRRWIDVENGFANWLAVENNGTWQELRDGL